MRLPDIQYNPGNVRPLAKEDPAIAARKAQVEIDLSKARLGAELDTASAIGKANIRLARERLEADKDLIHSQAQMSISAFDIASRMKTQKRNTNLQIAGNLATTAISVASKWYEGQEDVKVARGITNYSAGVRQLSTELSSQQTINLNDYPDVDFRDIPESMIYTGRDAVTGREVRSAPAHLAAPIVFQHGEERIRVAASDGITSTISIAKFENGIAGAMQSSTLEMIRAKYDGEHKFLSGQYEESLTSAINGGDMPTGMDIINSAEARGVWSAEYAGKRRAQLGADIKFSQLVKTADSATSLDQLAKVKEATYDLPKSEQISIRAVIGQRENEIQQKIEKARVESERTQLNIQIEQANALGMGTAGGWEEKRAAVVEYAKQTNPEHLDAFTSSFQTRFNQAKNAERQRVTEVTDAWFKAASEDPSVPIPAEIDGQAYVNAKKYKAIVESGAAPTTNMKRFAELQQMVVENPEKFKNMALGPELVNLDEGDWKYFSGIQQKMKQGNFNHTQVVGASAQFEDFAAQAFGKGYEKNSDRLEKANALRQAYVTRVEQLEATQKAQTTAGQRQEILNDIFLSQHSVYSKGWFGGVREGVVSLSDKKVAQYIPAISAVLKQNKIPVTSENIIKEYNARLTTNRLEELDY